MPAKRRNKSGESDWLPLPAYGAKLLARAMVDTVIWDDGATFWDGGQTLWYAERTDEVGKYELGGSGDRRDRMLRYQHEISGEVKIRQFDPATGEWLNVNPGDWQTVEWTFGLLQGGLRPTTVFTPAEVRVIELASLPPHQQRIRLLREVWLRAGSPADWTAVQAREAALALRPEAKRVLMAVTLRQIRRDLNSAKADIKRPKPGRF